MALNAATGASAIYTALSTHIANWPSTSFPSAFASAYKTYSQAGTLSGGGGVSGSESEGILSSFLSSFTSNTTPDDFAQTLANYWATCLLVPAGGVISVVNDAASKKSAFKTAILASLTTTEKTPYFKDFMQNIQSIALPTITWTVLRVGTPPYVTLETVS